MSTKIIGVTVGTPTSPTAMAEKLKPVTSINGKTPDENGNVDIAVGSGSGQNTTWDTLEGKPTYMKTGPRTVVWDGAMDGDRFVATSYDTTATYLKISNEIPSKEELVGAKLTHSSEVFAPGPITDIDDGIGCYDSGNCGILVVTQAWEIEDSYSRKGIAPGTGIYVRLEGYEGQDSPYLRLSYGNYSQEKFEPAWLPDGGFGWEGAGGRVDILPESALVMDENTQTMPMPDGRTLYGYLLHPLPITENLTEGEEYQITIDGITYRKTCVVPDVDGIPYRFLGNLALFQMGEDTGEDWAFFVQEADDPPGYWVGMFATTNTEYKTVAVSAQGTVVHPIEDRFIPASVARKTDIPQKDSITPHIGANGNWWIGEEDTGVKAQGPQGDPGPGYELTEEDKADIAGMIEVAIPETGEWRLIADVDIPLIAEGDNAFYYELTEDQAGAPLRESEFWVEITQYTKEWSYFRSDVRGSDNTKYEAIGEVQTTYPMFMVWIHTMGPKTLTEYWGFSSSTSAGAGALGSALHFTGSLDVKPPFTGVKLGRFRQITAKIYARRAT